MRSYEYRHVITFEDTNVVGNVYYVNHLRWQGRCRELFLREHAPDVYAECGADLLLVTTRCSCEYFAELGASDEVIVRMTLGELAQNRITMVFEYHRAGGDGDGELVARGEQVVKTMRRLGNGITAIPVPPALCAALEPYRRDA